MRLVCSLILWSTFAGFLAAIGMIVFYDVRNRPRCIIPNCTVLALSDDGSKVITTDFRHDPAAMFPNTTWKGPVKVWDTRTGELVETLIENPDYYLWKSTPDKGVLAILPQDGSVRIVDLRDCTQEFISLTKTPRRWQSHKLELSPNGRWLACYLSATEDAYVHLPTREVVPYLRAGFLCFNGNEDAFVYRTGLEDDKETTIYGLKACDVVAKFPHEWDYLDPSPNGKHWVVAAAPEGAESWEFEILDVQERSTRILTRNGHAAVFSPDSRFLVLWHTRKKKAEHTDSEDYGYDLYEIATGDRRRIPVQDVWNYQFNEDSSLFVVQGWNGMSVFEFPSCRLAWQRKSDSRTKFADKKGIILGMNRGSVEIIDARTGDTHTSKLFGFSPLNAVTFTPSQDHFVVQGLEKRSETLAAWEKLLAKWKPELFAEDRRCVIVGETASGRELCRVFQDGKCFVSADGSALAIVTQGDTGAKVITRVWDVYPDRAWRFAIGTSLSAGLALLVVHHGMCKRRRNAGKAPTAAPAIPV